jgi:hypothetical protein
MTCVHCQHPKPASEIQVTWCQQDVCNGCVDFHIGHCKACQARIKNMQGVK